MELDNLFSSTNQIKTNAPLADKLRPRNLDEFFGQESILGNNSLLRNAILNDKVGNIIFSGPPGVGKTTLIEIISSNTRSSLIKLNAVLSSIKELRTQIANAKERLVSTNRKTILFIDEVHRFTSVQQDALLPVIENGTITFIGATTENPFFAVNKALISRSRIFSLLPLTKNDLKKIIEKVIKYYANSQFLKEEVDTKIVFLPRDPEWAYVFWQISESDRDKAQSLGANKLCLRLYDATNNGEGMLNQGTLREIAVDSYSTEWYLPIPLPDKDYKVELGYKYGFKWMSLAFSSTSHVPGSQPSEQILDKFVPFNLDSPSSQISTTIQTSKEGEINGLHERLYQAATSFPSRRRVGSEEFMEDVNSANENSNLTDSGAGIWSSGLNESGSGIVNNRSFWLVADAELIVYGATDPSAKLTIGGEEVPLAADGTFRIQVPFRDGTQKYEIQAVDTSGDQKKSITMKFDRFTPLDNTNEKDNAETEWF